MQGKEDILSLIDIKLLVDTFYERIQKDDLLELIFNERIKDNWPEHLDKMYRFWQTVLLEEYTYGGRPFPPHAQLPIDEKHFNQWLALFTRTVDELFSGDKAAEAKWRANKMATMFQSKLAYLRNNPFNIV
ncbi:group III truncated hemoglobin [Mucilaginibacter achroorhodeus]|uniref:Group III truncated hemoglobin n=1 Tax=Mucilaginibacter achroorhodeus TaxID=2599294 RepID=A0A563U2K2_9SPHI|nr:group III truncated hemoglobin [Mucilaginibacter achroorhodeus]TWR25565.1 group III truncated hemoglobin [Mucilaginibacter achroorhodeus]